MRALRVAGGLAASLAIGACDTTGGEGITALALLDGEITVSGPEHYCVDPRASQPETGFAVMAGCALLSDTAVMPRLDGLLTVQFGQSGSASVAGAEEAMRDLLQSPAGAVLLSDAGDPATVTIGTVEASGGLVIVEFRDTAPAQREGLETLEWRAFLDIGGRLTTVSVRGFVRAPLTREAGLRLLYETIDALRLVNRPAAAQQPVLAAS